ncbi:hypothetical protein BY458DRAFT_547594 [Sporodiniella umbellata]|nr:hypothetical protein BY458DRAFT_547594 [Sporodiniella umbellata]
MSQRDTDYKLSSTVKHTSAYNYEPIAKSNHNSLQDVISRYQKNPELLKLILASKVEEDKRKTEEAKLKSKELDVYINRQKFENRRRSFPSKNNSFRRIAPCEEANITSALLPSNSSHSKRRRSIQVVSRATKSNEVPMNDGLFRKNSGNTLQKKN